MPRRSGRRRRPPPKEPKPPRQRRRDDESSEDDDDDQDDVKFVNLLGPPSRAAAAAAAARGPGPVVPYGDPSMPPRLKYGTGKYEKYGWDRNAPPTAQQFQQLMQAFQYHCLVQLGKASLSDDEGEQGAGDISSSEDEEPINAPAITNGEDEEDSDDGGGATIEYEFGEEAALVEAVRGARRIKLLTLAQLHLSEGQDAELFPGPDKKVDIVLEALEAGTSSVEGLELSDAHWAETLDYSDRLVRLLGKYSGSLRYLSISSRALVQPNKKRRKHTLLKVVSRMPRLERLQLGYLPMNRHFYTYTTEFRDTALFPALKDLEVHLRLAWFQEQFQYAIPPVQSRWDRGSMAGFRYSDECGGYKDEEKDIMLPDILSYKKDIISYLDMSAFGIPTTYRLPILDRFAHLTNLRGIGLPVEYAAVTASMKMLEKVNLMFHQATADQAAAAAAFIQSEGGSAVWAGLRHLNANTQLAAKAHGRVAKGWNGVLGALAATCKQLRHLLLTGKGSGWDADLVAALVEANQAHLEEVELTVSDSLLTPRHLELLLAAPALRSVKLRRPAQKAGGPALLDEKAWSDKGVAVEWL